MDTKFLLLEEEGAWPAVALGVRDLFGTDIFRAIYMTVGKQVGDFDFTAGYGTGRIDGVFGGVRYRPQWLKGFGLVAEYDANDYKRDIGSSITGVDQRKHEVVAGLEYRYGWLGLQATYGHDEAGVNAYSPFRCRTANSCPISTSPSLTSRSRRDRASSNGTAMRSTGSR